MCMGMGMGIVNASPSSLLIIIDRGILQANNDTIGQNET